MVTPHTSIKMDTSDPLETDSIHKLQNIWNLWAHLPQDLDWTNKSYKLVYKFKTLEDSIVITESTSDPLIKGCMLFVMKDGISPVWEDPKNRNGGCFSYKISNKGVCEVWRELNYVLAGGSISNSSSFVSCVTGITISPKKNFCILKIWLNTTLYQDPGIIVTIPNLTKHGAQFRKHGMDG